MLAAWLIGTTGSDIAFAWYLIGITAVSLIVALTMPETSSDSAKLPADNAAQTATTVRASS